MIKYTSKYNYIHIKSSKAENLNVNSYIQIILDILNTEC
jgi:hypothetical protein